MYACGDVVTYGWIDSVLEIKKENNTRAHGAMGVHVNMHANVLCVCVCQAPGP